MNVVAKVKRITLPGTDEQMIVLELGRDGDAFELSDGDEFMTVELAYDPWAARP